MAAAIALAERGKGRTGGNPSVGSIIVKQGRVIGRGWTQPGGRPHAEAMALDEAGTEAAGATLYVTLEPCAHQSERGPSCAESLVAARPARVVAALTDPDPRTAGRGFAALYAAGITVTQPVLAESARTGHITLKLATSMDGCIALADGSSRWITGDAARAHTHLERARCDAILVGAGTVKADQPSLNVRIPGLESRSPRCIMLGSRNAPDGWEVIRAPHDIAHLNCNSVLVEGGAQTASAFLAAGLVDRLMLYRAPILIGNGKHSLNDIGLSTLDAAHNRWQLSDRRMLGKDILEVYEAACLPASSQT
jgi:diaminohydroxyphosphoribosylaminopyrimidine deaminase / 5-amino-6-(5-phosphoribosylamino)uracil reductase